MVPADRLHGAHHQPEYVSRVDITWILIVTSDDPAVTWSGQTYVNNLTKMRQGDALCRAPHKQLAGIPSIRLCGELCVLRCLSLQLCSVLAQ